MWLADTEARLKWKLASVPENAEPEADLAQAETQQIGGAALSDGLFTNPLLRAVLTHWWHRRSPSLGLFRKAVLDFANPTNCYLMRGSTTARAFL
jgi:hypothetical protein